MKTTIMVLFTLLFGCQAQAVLFLSHIQLGDSRFYTGNVAAYLMTGDATTVAAVTAQIQAGTFNSHTPLNNILDPMGLLRGVRTLLVSEATALTVDLGSILTLSQPFFVVVFSPDGTRFIISEVKTVTLLNLTVNWDRAAFGLSSSGLINLDLWLSVGSEATTYETWANARFGTTGANRGFDDDFDGNGVSNGVEYAFGSSAKQNGLISIATDDAGMVVIDTPKPNSARSDLQINVIGRHDLVTGAWGDLPVRKTSVQPSESMRYEADETPQPPKGFFRMTLSQT